MVRGPTEEDGKEPKRIGARTAILRGARVCRDRPAAESGAARRGMPSVPDDNLQPPRYCRCVGKGRDVLNRYGIPPDLIRLASHESRGICTARKRLPVWSRPSPRPRRPAPDDAILIRQTVTVRSPEIDHPRRVAERRDRGRRHVAPGLRSGPRCSRGRTAGSPFPGTRVLSDVPLPELTCPRRQCNRPAPSVGADTPDKRCRVR